MGTEQQSLPHAKSFSNNPQTAGLHVTRRAWDATHFKVAQELRRRQQVPGLEPRLANPPRLCLRPRAQGLKRKLMLRKGSDLSEAAVGTKPLPDSTSRASPTERHCGQGSLQGRSSACPHVFPTDPCWGCPTLSKPSAPAVSPPHWPPTFSAQTVHPPQCTGRTPT